MDSGSVELSRLPLQHCIIAGTVPWRVLAKLRACVARHEHH